MTARRYRITHSYNIERTGGVSNISVEIETREPTSALTLDISGGRNHPVVPFLSSAREELIQTNQRLEKEIKADLLALETTIEASVKHLFATVNILDGAIRQKKSTVVKNLATLAPIRRVPPEILRLVFVCLGTPVLPLQNDFLLDLMLVSRSWYHGVLNTPQMWTDFDLDACQLDSELYRLFWYQALARGKTLPLNLKFVFRSVFFSPITESLRKTMFSRCSRLELLIHTHQSGPLYEVEIDSIFEMLAVARITELKVTIQNGTRSRLERYLKQSTSVQFCFSQIQKHLRRLEMEEADFTPLEVMMPQLEKLTLRRIDLDPMLLRKWTMIAPNISDLCILDSASASGGWNEFRISPPYFQNTNFLELTNTGTLFFGSGEQVIMSCPFAQTVVLRRFSSENSLCPGRMQNLKHLIICITRRLDLPGHSHEKLMEWFSGMSNLECLEIRTREHEFAHEYPQASTDPECGAILLALSTSNTSGNPNICPLLKSVLFTIHTSHDREVSMDTGFLDAILGLSRFRKGGRRGIGLLLTLACEDKYQRKTTIVADADYWDLHHALQTEPLME